jgi:hypothetical protein
MESTQAVVKVDQAIAAANLNRAGLTGADQRSRRADSALRSAACDETVLVLAAFFIARADSRLGACIDIRPHSRIELGAQAGIRLDAGFGRRIIQVAVIACIAGKMHELHDLGSTTREHEQAEQLIAAREVHSELQAMARPA